MKIISIYQSGKRKKITHVVTAADEDIWVDSDFIMRHALREGMEIDDGAWAGWIAEWQRRRAMDAAFTYLGYRGRSRAEMETRLREKGCSPQAIDYVMEKLSGYGYLDDAQYARDYLTNCRGARPKGRMRIRAELRERGLSDDSIEQALSAYDEEEELAQAIACLRKLLAQRWGKTPEIRKKQCCAALMRRGFNWEIVSRAWARVDGEAEDAT